MISYTFETKSLWKTTDVLRRKRFLINIVAIIPVSSTLTNSSKQGTTEFKYILTIFEVRAFFI